MKNASTFVMLKPHRQFQVYFNGVLFLKTQITEDFCHDFILNRLQEEWFLFRRWWSLSFSKVPEPFKEPEDLSPQLQASATNPYSEPDEYCPHCYHLFLHVHFNIILPHVYLSELISTFTGFRLKFHMHFSIKSKVKQSRYTLWRRLGGEEV
jgi:hypothetical protein